MSWNALNRNETKDESVGPLLSEATKDKIRSFFPRYETKRAVLLPALHIVQEALGHISLQAMKEVAEVLEIHPSDVLDVVSFYTHFSAHAKGRKTVLVCRSLSCELLGGKKILDELKTKLGVDDHGTSADGVYTLETEECLAACDFAPCMMVNERMHKNVRCDQIDKILEDPRNDVLPMPRNPLFDPPPQADGIEPTSDVQEMAEAD